MFVSVICTQDRQVELQTCRTRQRAGHQLQQVVITIGGEIYNKNYLSGVDCYNVQQSKWNRLKELPFPRCHHGAALYEGSVIYVAGKDLWSPLHPSNVEY